MNRQLPPFSAIRAFEAAARNLSFKRAAEELHVSQSAISHQIRNLESFLEMPLFLRGSGGVALTESGTRYLADVGRILDSLDECTHGLKRDAELGPLRIQVTPAFASRWLVPRMRRFHEQYPEIELHVATAIDLPDFDAGEIDFVIQYGMDTGEDLVVEPLLMSTRAPVCSRDYQQSGPQLAAPADLCHFTLLRDRIGDAWHEWLTAAGVEPAIARTGPVFAHCDLTLRAAEEGQGFALAYIALIEDALAAGTLIMPFTIETPPKAIYSTVFPERYADRAKVRAFDEWVRGEIELDRIAREPARRRAV